MTSRLGVWALWVPLLLTACGARTPPPLDPPVVPGVGVGVQASNSLGTTGTITANGETVILTLNDLTAVSIQATGTWTGTLEFETTTDGATWVSADLAPSDSTTAVSTITANGLWQGGVGGRQLRVRSTAWSSGTATVYLNAFPGSFGGGGGGGGDASAANQTTQITHLAGGMGYLVLDAMDATTGWTVLNTDAATLATTTDNIEGSAALSFDKADGAANTIYGMIQKTLASVDLSPYGPAPVLKVRFQATTYADMINIVVRLGVDASNYLEFLCAPTGAPVSVWSECYIPLTSTTAAAVGTGWDSTDIDHIQVGAQFSDEADTLVGLLIDEIVVQAGLPQSSEQWDNAFLPEGGTHDTGERGILAFGVHQAAQVDFAADGSRVPMSIDGSGRVRVEATSTVLTDVELNTQSLVDNQVTASTHDTPVDATGLNLICEAADVDGSALPNVATAEGRGGRPKCSTAFVLLTAPTDETGLNPGFDLEGNALGAGVLLQGDDGTDRTNLLVDTAGHPQVDVLTMPSVVDHDAADTDPRLGIGLRALAHGTNPTAVAASDRTVWYGNRAGIPFMIGGHPNVITLESQVQDADGAQTNLALVTVGAGAKVVVTRASFKCSNANTVDVTAVLGFGTATIPARAHTGVTGIVASFDEIPAGGGSVEGSGAGILGIGADNEDLRLTMDDPVSGACVVNVSYYTIES